VPQLRSLLAVAVFAMALVDCAGCSEECSGLKAGSPGCPCSTDQDCSTQLGAVLLCADGACADGDPPDAPGNVACSGDGDCASGEACGGDGTCAPAPTCQRLTGVTLHAATAGATPEPVGPTVQDCRHLFDFSAPAVTASVARIRLDGTAELENQACAEGRWFAAYRVGRFVCGGAVIAVSPTGLRPCVGADCGAGCDQPPDADVGVCR
jgi:hypothetical protein